MLPTLIYSNPLISAPAHSHYAIIRSFCICSTSSSHESRSTSTNLSSSPVKAACKYSGVVAFSSPNLLFIYSRAFYEVIFNSVSRTPSYLKRIRILTRPVIAAILDLPTAIIRLPNSTIIGFVFDLLALATNASITSPIPAAKLLFECVRLNIAPPLGDPLLPVLDMLDRWVDMKCVEWAM